jgi:hypothetical protein
MDAEKMSKDFDHIVCPFVDDRNEVEHDWTEATSTVR